jgi:hypothetical protein
MMTFYTYPESTPQADWQPACGTLLNWIFPTRNLPTCRAGLQGLLDGRMTAILLPTAEAVGRGKKADFASVIASLLDIELARAPKQDSEAEQHCPGCFEPKGFGKTYIAITVTVFR